MLTVIKEFTFDAAHYLPDYEGPCKNLHGHTFLLQVGVSGNVNSLTGMIIDFAELSQFIKTTIIQLVDHTLLNDIQLDDFPIIPTAENIVLWIVDKVNDFCNETNRNLKSNNQELTISLVRLWETPTNFCEWKA